MPANVTHRVRMSRAQRREQLLDVAKAIVHDGGFHAVSIEAVARGARITRPIVYDHFGNLGELLAAMLERETARALGQLARLLPAAREADDPRDALLASLKAYLDAVAGDPVTWRLVLMPPEGAPKELHERIGAARDAIVATLAEIVRPGLVPDRPSPDPPLTARLLAALSDEAARLLLTHPELYPVDRLMAHARWLIRELIRG